MTVVTAQRFWFRVDVVGFSLRTAALLMGGGDAPATLMWRARVAVRGFHCARGMSPTSIITGASRCKRLFIPVKMEGAEVFVMPDPVPEAVREIA